MNRKRMYLVAAVLLMGLSLVGCAAEPTTFSVNLVENECTYDGPKAVPKGEFRVELNIQAQTPAESGFSLFALDEGKTIEDFKAWPTEGADKPPFIMELAAEDEFSAGTYAYTYDSGDFWYNVNYKGQPAYLVCLRVVPETNLLTLVGGPFGPIEVKR